MQFLGANIPNPKSENVFQYSTNNETQFASEAEGEKNRCANHERR